MHNIIRVATLATLFAIPALIAADAPGFALGLDKSLPAAQRPTITAPAPTPPVPAPVAIDDVPAPSSHADDIAEPETLADLVAAQPAADDPDGEMRCLASAIYYEAKGEPMKGQLAVAHVILNRTRSGRFPASVCGVVAQRGQFSFVRAGIVPSPNPRNAAYRTAMAIAQIARDEAWANPVSEALFFHAAHVSPNWGKRRVAAIGGHIFYR